MNITFPRPETMDPPDKYDLDEQELLEGNPNEREFQERIREHWMDASPLFKFLGPDSNQDIGCPTMVQSNEFIAETEELTIFVRGLDIPDRYYKITEESLTQFKIAQREADRVLGLR